MSKIKNVIWLLFFLSLLACNKQNSIKNLDRTADSYEASPISTPSDKTGNIDDDISANPNKLTDDEIKKIGKKIIKTAFVTIEVNDYTKRVKEIKNILKNFDCYISSETEDNYSGAISNVLVIRVKSSQFDSLMNTLLNGEGEVISKKIDVQDVTEQYIDVYQRLKNKKLVEKQYQELLKKANTINDILNVQNYLRQIREEIDATEGRLKFLDNQTSYSTITLTIRQKEQVVEKSKFWNEIKNGLVFGWNLIVYIILAFFYIWPVWILVVIIIFVVKRQKNKPPKNIKND